MTAQEQYQNFNEEIDRLISELQNKLGNHRAEFHQTGGDNFGYPGDLVAVIEHLSIAVEFIGGKASGW